MMTPDSSHQYGHSEHHRHNGFILNLTSGHGTATSGYDDSDMTDLLVAKGTAMTVLFVATCVCGTIPFLLNRCFKWTENNTNAHSGTVVKCLLYFGGGVLLCTTFLHLLPEIQETVESLQACGTLPELSFSLANLVVCIGFLVMLLIEELIHSYMHRHQQSFQDEASVAFERSHILRNSHLIHTINNSDHKRDDNVQPKEVIDANSSNAEIKLSIQDLLSNDIENQKYQAAVVKQTSTQPSEYQYTQHVHDHVHSNHSHLPTDNGKDLIASSLRGLLIVFALSLHEFFEGLAIGLEPSVNTVWFMLGAVSAHKLVLAFCVGVELIVAQTKPYLSAVYVITFAIVSPIGTGIGIAITNQDTTAPGIPSAILQGLACGTLLYVIFFEVLSKNRTGLLAYLALFIGFGFMFGLQQVAAGHEHSHGACATDQFTEPHTDTSRSLTNSDRSLTSFGAAITDPP